MARLPADPQPPFQAGPGRRLLHTFIAATGWVTFVEWWSLVLHKVSREEIEYTFFFLAIAIVVVVALTILWAAYNVWVYRRKGPRRHVHAVVPDFTHDRVGRRVNMPKGIEPFREAALVRVRIVDGVKSYEASPVALAAPTAGGPGSAAR